MITSLQNPLIKDIAKLHQKKYRHATNTFIIEGDHVIEEARKNHLVKTIITTNKDTHYSDAIIVSESVMKKLSSTHHIPTVIAVCTMQLSTTLTDRVLILEHIQDPGNLGTLLRSALAFGFETIVLDEAVDLYNPKVLRSTQGALFHLSFLTMSAPEFKAKHPDYTLIATAVNGNTTIVKPKDKYALILGNEGSGIHKDTLAIADTIITIPMATMESLNVAVAGSIIMHQLNGIPFTK
jgi:TrmH family RNA methyltransferase